MKNASTPGKQLMAEVLWVLSALSVEYEESNEAPTDPRCLGTLRANTGRKIIRSGGWRYSWALGGGPGFNTYRPNELEYLLSLVRDLKQKAQSERKRIFADYDAFLNWIESVSPER